MVDHPRINNIMLKKFILKKIKLINKRYLKNLFQQKNRNNFF